MVTSSSGLAGSWASPGSALTACMGQVTAKDFTVFYVILGVLLVCLLVPPTRPSDLEEQCEARVIRQRRRELWADKLVFWGGQTWELTGRGRRLPNPLALTWHSFWRSATWRADAWYHLCNHHVQLSLLFADRLGPYGHLGHKCAWLLCALLQLLSVLVLSRALSVGQCWVVLGIAVPLKLVLTQNTVLHTLLLRCGGGSLEGGNGSAVVMAQGSQSTAQQEAALLQALERQADRRLMVFSTMTLACCGVLAVVTAALTAVLSPTCNAWWADKGMGPVAGSTVLGWWVLGQASMGLLSLVHCGVLLWPCASLSLTLCVWGKGRGVPLISLRLGLWRRQLLLSLFHPSTRLAPVLHGPLIAEWAKALPCPPAPPLSRAAPPSDFWSAVLAAIDVPLWPHPKASGPHRPWVELRACRLPADLCVDKGILDVHTYPHDLPLAPPSTGSGHSKHGSLSGSTGSSPTSHASNRSSASSKAKGHHKARHSNKGGSQELLSKDAWHKADLAHTTTLPDNDNTSQPSSAPGSQVLRLLGLASGRRKKKKKALAVILDAHSPASSTTGPLRRRSVDLDRRRGEARPHNTTHDQHDSSGSDSPSGVLSPVLAATHPPSALTRHASPPPLSPRLSTPRGPSSPRSNPASPAVPMNLPNKLEHLSITAGLDRATAKEVLAVQLASKASRRRKSQLLSGDLPQRRASTVPLPPPDHHSPPPSPSPLQDGDEPFAFPPASRSRASVRGLGLGAGLGAQAGEGEGGQGEEGEVRLRNAASLSSSSSDDDYDDTHTHKTTTHKTGSPPAVPPLMLPMMDDGRRRASLAVGSTPPPAGRRPSLSPVAFKTVVPSPLPSTPGLTPTSTHTDGVVPVSPVSVAVSPVVSPAHRRRMSALQPITVVYAEDDEQG